MEILNVLQSTPLPIILVVGGLALFILSVVSRIGGKVIVTTKRQKSAAILGGILLALGIILYLLPSIQTNVPVITGVTIRETYYSGELIVQQDIHFRDKDGDANYINWEQISLSNPNATIDISDGTVNVPPEQQKNGAVTTGKWRCVGGEVYYIDLEVSIMDAAGNYSQPFLYTINCHD